ncbi:MAG: hypothetical protein ACQEP6_01245 [Patescibacteria group bacterium]
MDSEEEVDERVEEIRELARENNKMLRKLYSAQRRSLIFTLFYWAVIVVLAVIAYIYIEPYLDRLEDLYTTAHEASKEAQEVLERSLR